AGRRGAGGHLLAAAHQRSEGNDWPPAAAGGAEPGRSRSAVAPHVRVRHPPADDRPDRRGARLGAGRAAVKVTVAVVGKIKAPFAEADAHYPKLLQRHLPVDLVEVRDEVNLEGRIPPRSHLIALDRGGRA